MKKPLTTLFATAFVAAFCSLAFWSASASECMGISRAALVSFRNSGKAGVPS